MDLFRYIEDYRILVCLPCGFAVPPSYLRTYLSSRHRDHPDLSTKLQLDQAAEKLLLERLLVDPGRGETPTAPAAGSPPIAYLPVYRGVGCARCPYTTRTKEAMSKHYRRNHPDLTRPRGRQPRVQAPGAP